MDDHTIPERRQGHQYKSERQPQKGTEYGGKPIRKNP
jgi:hypothetical protein